MSIFTKLFSKIYKQDEARCLMVGLDAAGKTTVLYKMKLGEVVTTIPTIGFNVETVDLDKNFSFTVWDVGGRDKIRPLWRHYYQNTTCIIFVVDSNDRERIDDSSGSDNSAKEEMHRMLAEDELRDCSLIVLANKQDLPNAMSVDEITNRLALNELRNRKWFIIPTCAVTGEGLDKFKQIIRDESSHKKLTFEEWQKHMQNKRKTILLVSAYVRQTEQNNTLMSFIPVGITRLIHILYQDPNWDYDSYPFYGEFETDDAPKSVGYLNMEQKEILIEFLSRKDDDDEYEQNDNNFIEAIAKNGTLQSIVDNTNDKWDRDEEYIEKWDHYNFLRMIWILFKDNGRREGLKLIWKYTPHNVSVTYFWSQMVYFGINANTDNNICDYTQTDFEYFLIMNPCYSNDYKHLMNKYYSDQQLVKANERKDEMVLPDKMPLPSLVTDVEKLKKKLAEEELSKEEEHKYDNMKTNDDASFIVAFENRSFKNWEGHKSFLRVVWCYVNEYNASQQSVKKCMLKWKEFEKDRYHETKTYFWIHMIRYYRVLFGEYLNDKNDDSSTFDNFLKFCEIKNKKSSLMCKILDSEWWTDFYSENVMENKGFNGIDAKDQMVFPDIKQLPQLHIVKKKKN